MTKIGSGSTIDPNSLAALLQKIEGGNATTDATDLPVPDGVDGNDTPPPPKPVDRNAAQAKLAALGASPIAVAGDDEAGVKANIEERLKKLGYLPQSGKISQTQLAEAEKKFITEHKGDANPSMDIDLLMSLIDDQLAKENQRQNPSPAQWSGQRPSTRPAGMPPASTYANQGPAPNSAALQQQAATSVATAHPPPPAGSINAKIADACKKYMGTSTAAGPDGGNLACAWSVNNILSNAGLQKVGSNPNYVPSVEQALQGGRGTAVDAKDAQPGDIVIFPGAGHIGIYMGNGMVANNSSSRAAFVNMTPMEAGMHIYRVNS